LLVAEWIPLQGIAKMGYRRLMKQRIEHHAQPIGSGSELAGTSPKFRLFSVRTGPELPNFGTTVGALFF
jgi:hypothetical protein